MKLAVVYNPNDPKLLPAAYSWTYRDMLMAVLARFAPVQTVTANCSAGEIDAEAILFYDVHSSHEITIDGIERHPAVKLEYFNDPHQIEQTGRYSSGQVFHKLGAVQRTERARRRGVGWIICPYAGGYAQFIAPHAGDIQPLWFPVAPTDRRRYVLPLCDRRPEVLANGHCWAGEDGFRPYEFRRWAFSRPGVTLVGHAIDARTPRGYAYPGFLSTFAGALALCDTYVVPKYLEIPLAGCITFCQMLPEYRQMGFIDGVNCIAVDRENFDDRIAALQADPAAYQPIATAGRQVALKYTADRFAEWLYGSLQQILQG